MTDAIKVISQHLRLTGSLFYRYALLLSAIWAAGTVLDQLLLRAAVWIGLQNRLLGLVAIAPVILLQLVIFVVFFVILRNGLPRMRMRMLLRRRQPAPEPEPGTAETEAPPSGFAIALLAVLVPFYGYYAGWGLLGDTLRSYSQIFLATQMSQIDFNDPKATPTALEVSQTGWVILAVLLVWAIRKFAKYFSERTGKQSWSMLIVLCEATWALLGLYVISGWKNEIAGWMANLPPPGDLMNWFVSEASAAITDASAMPVDWPPAPQLWPTVKALFWYALLPLVWFNLGAIVYGHDMNAVRGETDRLAGRALRRWEALPKPVTDFLGHFWRGVIKRWHAVTNGILLAASAGFALTASVLVLWRLVDWLGNWAWIGLAHLIGPQDMQMWQIASVPLNVLFDAPGAPPGGLLVSPLQFCILAAGLELAGRAQDAAQQASRAAAASPG